MFVFLLRLQTKRDILTETKYIELVLVADHQEVSNSEETGLKPPLDVRLPRGRLVVLP